MDVQIIGVMVVAAWVIERLFEAIVSPLFDRFGWDRFWILDLALAVGSTLAWFTGLNGFPVFTEPLVGRVLSCLAMGLGPSFLYDLADRPHVDRVEIHQVIPDCCDH